MIRDLQELKDMSVNEQISFIRIKEDEDLLKCEAFSAKGFIGNYVLRNKFVIEKVKGYAVINKVKGEVLNDIIRDVARMHLKYKGGWMEQS